MHRRRRNLIAIGFVALHKDVVFAAHHAIEKLHAQTFAVARPRCERLARTHEMAVRADRRLGNKLRSARLRFADACIEDIDFAAIDLCFCALPHGTSQDVIDKLPRKNERPSDHAPVLITIS